MFSLMNQYKQQSTIIRCQFNPVSRMRQRRVDRRTFGFRYFSMQKLAVLGLALSLSVLNTGVLARSTADQVIPKPQAVLNYQDRAAIFEPVQAPYGMVASDHVLASEVGADILARGGQAVDAAVATAFTLAVVLPYAGNLGGGGFAVLYQQQTNEARALDFRETAPDEAHETMFLDTDGNPVPGMSIQSTASIGVPGSVAGLLTLLEEEGTMTREQVMSQAIAYARHGFRVTPTLARLLRSHEKHLYKSAPNRSVFFKKRQPEATCILIDCPLEALEPLQVGDLLKQPNLAKTLQSIANDGVDGFYTGEVAQDIVQTVNEDVGAMSLSDLANYRPVWRTPIRSEYRGMEIVSMPPPSSGGIHLVQMLNMLSHYPIAEHGFGSAISLHLLAEVGKRAYADRAQYLGDPDFTKIPVSWLVSQDYAQERIADLSLTQATSSEAIAAGEAPEEGTQTTHLSVTDRWGNLVSLTTTLNLNFGSGWMTQQSGVLLNNEMDDFSVKPGLANAFGLTGSQANRIEPGKRPLSSMTPTLVFKDGQPWLATGSPGGARIITIVLQQILNMVDHRMNLATSIAAPRMHHQWKPDRLFLEPGYSPDTIHILQMLGQNVEASRAAGRVESVIFTPEMALGYSDPRSGDGAAIGPLRLKKSR